MSVCGAEGLRGFLGGKLRGLGEFWGGGGGCHRLAWLGQAMKVWETGNCG